MIGRALGWLLKKTGNLLLNAVSVAAVVGVTALDHLAWGLTQGARLSKEIGGHVATVIDAIWGFLGRKMGQVADVTVAFMRWVLELLFSTVRSMATTALSIAEIGSS